VTDVYEILRRKELDCARLRQEVEALRVAARLLDPAGVVDPADEAGETLDEMITRERALAEPATAPEGQEQSLAAQPEAGAEKSDSERKGPSASDPGQTTWWRRLSGT